MGYDQLDELRGKIKSKKGGWIIGEGVFVHGYNLLSDIVGKKSFFELVILNATGRLPTKQLAYWVESVYSCLSWPDPRIWCNRVGALAGTNGCSPVSASFSGVLSSDSKSYGVYPLLEGVKFIQKSLIDYKKGHSILECIEKNSLFIKGKPAIVGYARPIAKGDERIEAMERVTIECGFEYGDHLLLAYDVERFLIDKYDEAMNINGFVSAFMSDQNFSAIEIYRIFSSLVFSGVVACYVDAKDKDPGFFSPFRVEDIEYIGVDDRDVLS